MCGEQNTKHTHVSRDTDIHKHQTTHTKQTTAKSIAIGYRFNHRHTGNRQFYQSRTPPTIRYQQPAYPRYHQGGGGNALNANIMDQQQQQQQLASGESSPTAGIDCYTGGATAEEIPNGQYTINGSAYPAAPSPQSGLYAAPHTAPYMVDTGVQNIIGKLYMRCRRVRVCVCVYTILCFCLNVRNPFRVNV